MLGLRRLVAPARSALRTMPKRAMAFNTCWEDTIEDAKNIIGRGSILSPTDAQAYIEKNKESVIVLDVQDSVTDVIPGTINISLGTLGFKADSEMGEFADPTLAAAPKNTPIVVTCGLGGQAIVAAKMLLEYGFWQTKVVEGGCLAWKDAGLPMEKVA